ncbi:hypothetical protein H9L21_08210 [Aeromicrobium senzhongii]|uniref:Uncharacterized protein n=1 Tax=Aeromicrobium senzhongii TaxID=2663859 RepID=A0ABX6SQW2_9ACTN|nr:hypothetical protein [Aeromicrobium senzhongii]MTB87051.1 hypothetical protein [Aeromicrobium senzhongii]QNL93130.1 hypothetical protein H9L21_08210 [Aeromicrobium senzhongii]
MRLGSAIVGFFLRKTGIFIALVLTSFAAYLVVETVIPSVLSAASAPEKLESAVATKTAIAADAKKTETALEKRRDQICNLWERAGAKVLPGNYCKDAQRRLDKAEREYEASAKALADAENEVVRWEKAQDSPAGWVMTRWMLVWPWLVKIAAIVLLVPLLLRTFNYFVFMPLLVRAHKPFQLAGTDHDGARLLVGPAERTLRVSLSPSDLLSARSVHMRPVSGPASGRLLYDWRAPAVSYAAGLHGLTQLTGDEQGADATLAAPDNPDAYLMRIDFENHPGLSIRPRHVVGVIGNPQLRSRWKWGIHALATWQVRYVLFTGTGSLIIEGTGDVIADVPGARPKRIEQNLVMGFDTRLTVGITRTTVFWPYLAGRTPLVDEAYTGDHPIFWQKSTSDGTSNPLGKVFNSIFSSLGKVFGF